ncbi:HDOD domain-containing protein [Halarcobacter ebronensis]|uniref:HDOD domain-containing protein n=1 Tax=Halarcobacter ebronensis TaxID=1462615 RepID=A0A4Q0YEF8_9BACT|nr:HDOD domain-containing protein [Halarcobacter ebronensis]QKF80772.1 HDOD domain-containing protein [Halarcobacter ebronensis]RXJ68014.1 HDOD domain-containing protein [Halarcobacter ebronensis]RXK08565.1 HDOD domain-containing protein [Halarcobacter ebronensis]
MKKLIIEKIDSLPPLPKSVLELEEFRKMPNQEPLDLLKIIEKDPLIITTVLRVANSAMFGFVSEVETPSRAISLLGVNFTISIALGTVIQSLINTNLDAYNVTTDDFIFSSNLASSLVNSWVSKISFDLKEELLLPAFLQEVGKFVISEIIDETGRKEDFRSRLDISRNISTVEKEFLGYTCARITANIFKHWNLSHNLIFTIGFVEDLENCPKEYLQKVKILEIIKILCDMRSPLSDQNIQRALNKANEYGIDAELLLQSIDTIKFKLENSL